MADARRMGKMELFAHFADKFDLKRTLVRDLFEELMHLSEKGSSGRMSSCCPACASSSSSGARPARPQPGDGRDHQDSRQDRGQGQDREAAQGRRTAAQVAARSEDSGSRFMQFHETIPGVVL